MDVAQDTSAPAISPSPTPTNTVTPSITPSVTPTITSSVTPTVTPTTSITPSVSVTPSITPTNTPTPSSSPVPSGTTEANTYLTAVVTNGGTGINSTVSAATRTLFTTLVSQGVWDKLSVFYPILGATANSTKVNGKNPGTNDMVWNGGITYNVSGVTTNGSNGYGNTTFSATSLTQNSVHLSNYQITPGSANSGIDMGITIGGGNSLQMYDYEASVMGIKVNIANGTGYSQGNTGANARGFYVATRTGSTVQDGYRNTSRIINASVNSVGIPSGAIYVGARNTGTGTAEAFNGRTYNWFSIGTGLSGTDVTNLYNAIQTFNTSLARQV